MRRIELWAAVLVGVCPLGCSTVAPVVGSYATVSPSGFSYAAGRGSQEFAFPPAAVHQAVLDSMSDLRITSVKEIHDAGAVIFEGTTADDRSAHVTLRPNQAKSRLTVRMGWFGDEPLSRALMDRVGIRLGALPPEAIPDKVPSSPSSNPFFSRDAVPDEIMLRDQAEARYHDSQPIQ